MGYQSKFTGKQIDTILESVQNGSSNIELVEVCTDFNIDDPTTPFTLTEEDKEINRQAITKVCANQGRCLLYTKLKYTTDDSDTRYTCSYITTFGAYEETIGSGIFELWFILESDYFKAMGLNSMAYAINSSGEIIEKLSISGLDVLEKFNPIDLSDVQNAYDLYNKLSSLSQMVMFDDGLETGAIGANIPVTLPLKNDSSFLFGSLIDYTLDFIYLTNGEDGMYAIGYFSTTSGEYGVIYAEPEQFIAAVIKNGNIYLNPRATVYINQNKHLAYLMHNNICRADLSTFKLITDDGSYSIICAAGPTGFFMTPEGIIGSFTLNEDGSITTHND
jgi:hypothetical protein